MTSRRTHKGGRTTQRAVRHTLPYDADLRQPSDMTSSREIRSAYETGRRTFWNVDLRQANFEGADLRGASFYGSSLKGANFNNAQLTYVQLKGARLTGATFRNAALNATDLIGADFTGADFTEADLTGASLNRANLSKADLRDALLGNARFGATFLEGATFDGTRLSSTWLGDINVSAFCRSTQIRHGSPSPIDARTVMKSYTVPGLKSFMLDCGVPAIFAEYMIDCARSLGEPVLRSLMQSTFISYGGPDERFARKLYDALRAHGVLVFFFPESATLGERISNEVYRRLHEQDRVILVCSKASLERPGVLNEIQETFDREVRDGGANYLLPIMLDDYVLTGWHLTHPALAERVRQRVVGDFRSALTSEAAFEAALSRLIDALKVRRSRP